MGNRTCLAGLLREDERRSLSGFPGVINVLILRQLFSNNDRSVTQTDIVMLLTPHIIPNTRHYRIRLEADFHRIATEPRPWRRPATACCRRFGSGVAGARGDAWGLHSARSGSGGGGAAPTGQQPQLPPGATLAPPPGSTPVPGTVVVPAPLPPVSAPSTATAAPAAEPALPDAAPRRPTADLAWRGLGGGHSIAPWRRLPRRWRPLHGADLSEQRLSASRRCR